MRVALAAVLLLLTCACGAYRRSRPPRAPSDDVITRAQIEYYHFKTARDAVDALHANWLTVRGTDSFRTPSDVAIYMNSVRLGGPDALREIAAPPIHVIRYYDRLAATARFGVGHSQGAIAIFTYPDST